MAKRIAVVGGANMDIGGFPSARLVMGDSNPGKVRMTLGGVGRNIAENLSRLGLEVHLITALGNDTNGHAIINDCREKGTEGSFKTMPRPRTYTRTEAVPRSIPISCLYPNIF